MTSPMPEPIADYFAAENGNDPETLSQCFVEHGVVRDEGRTMEGTAAIKQWMAEAKKKYQHTVEPIRAVERGGKIVVIVKVAGSFPNSPVTLEHIFALDGAKIPSLEIR